MKRFCRYCVINRNTGDSLKMGYKYKDFDCLHLHYAGYFYRFLCFFRVNMYYDTTYINGVYCVVLYWFGGELPLKSKLGDMVTYQGKMLGLRGKFKSFDRSLERITRVVNLKTLDSLGYIRR